MVLDTSLLNTHQYKRHIKGKVEQSNPGKRVAHPLHHGVVAIEKGAFWSPSTMVNNFTLNRFKYDYVTLTIQFNISHLFTHRSMVKQFYLIHKWNPNRYNLSGSEWTWD